VEYLPSGTSDGTALSAGQYLLGSSQLIGKLLLAGQYVPALQLVFIPLLQ
jgi:hypothetical protein